jgi:ADP-ribose pyrophosphatase
MEILSKEIVREGYLKIEEQVIKASNGDIIKRDVLTKESSKLSDEAVTILLIDREKDELVLVEQFRQGAERKILEAVAGTLEHGEDPMECAVREAGEETGYSVTNIKTLGKSYSSPGCMKELTHFFIGDISDKISEGGGLVSEHEEITIVRYPISNIKLSDFEDLKTQRVIAEFILNIK